MCMKDVFFFGNETLEGRWGCVKGEPTIHELSISNEYIRKY